MTNANVTLKNKQVLLAHLASQSLPAPNKFPTRTADAIPRLAGTWKNVEAVERRTDWAASVVGPRRDAARAHASHAHHSEESYITLDRASHLELELEAYHDSSCQT